MGHDRWLHAAYRSGVQPITDYEILYKEEAAPVGDLPLL